MINKINKVFKDNGYTKSKYDGDVSHLDFNYGFHFDDKEWIEIYKYHNHLSLCFHSSKTRCENTYCGYAIEVSDKEDLKKLDHYLKDRLVNYDAIVKY